MATPTTYSEIKTTGYSTNITINNLTYSSTPSVFNDQNNYVAIINDYTKTPYETGIKTLNLPRNANMVLNTNTSFGNVQPIVYDEDPAVTSWGSYDSVFPNGFVMLELEESKSNASTITYTLHNRSSNAYNLNIDGEISVILLFSNPTPSETLKISCSYKITNQNAVEIKSLALLPNTFSTAITGSIPANGNIVFTLTNAPLSGNYSPSRANPFLFVSLNGITKNVSPSISFTNSLSQSVSYQTQDSFVPVVKAVPNLLNYTLDGAVVTFTVKNSTNTTTLVTKTGTFQNFLANPSSLLTYAQFGPGVYKISATYAYQSNYSTYIASSTSVITLTITSETLTGVLTTPANVSYTDTLNYDYSITSKDAIVGTLTLTIGDNLTPQGTRVYNITTYTNTTDPTSGNKIVTYSTSGLNLTARGLNTAVAGLTGTLHSGRFNLINTLYSLYNNSDTTTYVMIQNYYIAGGSSGNILERTELLPYSVVTFISPASLASYDFIRIHYYNSMESPTALGSNLYSKTSNIPSISRNTLVLYRGTTSMGVASTGINTIPGTAMSVKASFAPTLSNNYSKPADVTNSVAIYPVNLVSTVTPTLTDSSGNAQYATTLTLNAIPYTNGVSFSSVISSASSAPSVVFTIYKSSDNSVIRTVPGTFVTGTNARFQAITSTPPLPLGTYYVITTMATDTASLAFSYINASPQVSFTVVQAVTALTVNTPTNNIGIYELPLNITGTLTGAATNGSAGSFILYKTDDADGSNPVAFYNPIPVGTTNGTIQLGTTFTLRVIPSDLGVTSNPNQSFHFKLEWSIADATYTTSSSLFTIRGQPNNVITSLTSSNYVSGTSTVEDELNFRVAFVSSTDTTDEPKTGNVNVYYTTNQNSTPVRFKTNQTITGPSPAYDFTFKSVRDNLSSDPAIIYTFYATYLPINVDETDNINFNMSTTGNVVVQLIQALTGISSLSVKKATTSVTSADFNDVLHITSAFATTNSSFVPGTFLIEYKYSSDPSYSTLFSATSVTNGTYRSDDFTFNNKNLRVGEITIKATFTPTDQVNYLFSTFSITSFMITSTLTNTISAVFNNSATYSYLQDMSLTVGVTPFNGPDNKYLATTGVFELFYNTTLLHTTETLSFVDVVTQVLITPTIQLNATPKTYGFIASSTPYTLIAKFKPTNSNVSDVTKTLVLNVIPQAVTFALTTTKNTFLFGEDIPVTVTASNGLNPTDSANSVPNQTGSVNIITVVNGVSYTLGSGTFTESLTTVVTANLYNILNLTTTGSIFTLSAVVTSTDASYTNSVDANITKKSITVNSVPIRLKSLKINDVSQFDGTNSTIISSIYRNGLRVYEGENFTISGEMSVDSASKAFASSGSIRLQRTVNGVDYVYKEINLDVDGKFSETIPVSVKITDPSSGFNVKEGSFYLYYVKVNENFESTSLEESSPVPGEFFVTVKNLDYNIKLQNLGGTESDYKDGLFGFRTTMTLENNRTFLDSMFQNLASEDSLFTFTIFDQSSNEVKYSTTDPFNGVSFSKNINDSSYTQLSLSQDKKNFTLDFYFKPITIPLPAGTYNINCYFSGINAVFDPEYASVNNTANFITFTIDKTVPSIDMSILLNPTDPTSGLKKSSETTEIESVTYIHRQQPYLLLKIQSPLSITGAYNSANDILGVTTITKSTDNIESPIDFIDIDAANGVLVNYGTIVDGAAAQSTTITNIINIKVAQFSVLNAATYNIQCVFAPSDATNYTTSTVSIRLIINAYKPVISEILPIQIPNPTSRPPIDNTIEKESTNNGPNEINYDESFTVTNTIQRFDNTIVNYTSSGQSSAVDYSGIEGTIAYTYVQNGGGFSGPILSEGGLVSFGSTVSILCNENISFRSFVSTFGGQGSTNDSGWILYNAGNVINVNLSNLASITGFTSLVITMGLGENYGITVGFKFTIENSSFVFRKDVDTHPRSDSAVTFYNSAYSAPVRGTLTLPTNLVSITPSNDKLTWTTIVRPQQIPKNDIDGYTLSLQFQPSSSNFVNSDVEDTSIFMTIANALGTLTIAASTPQNTTPVSTTATLNYSSGPLTLSGQMAFVNAPEVDVRTGTISFSYENSDINNGARVNMLATARITGTELTQTFTVDTTELNSKFAHYTIYAKYTPDTTNYPSITQGNTVIVQVNPLMTLSFSSSEIVNTFLTGYQNGVSITAKLNTGVNTFTGGQATFTFTPTNGTPSIYIANSAFTNGVHTFNTNDVFDGNNTKLSDALTVSTYTITCEALSGNASFQRTTELSPISLTISAAQIPFNISIDKRVIFYKEANKLLPVLTATFNNAVIGGTNVSLNWSLTGATNTTPYTYTQNLTNTEYIAVYNFRLPVDLPVDTYTISCSITSPNYGTYFAVNTQNVFLSVNKNNDVKIVASSVPLLYTPVTYPSSITVTASMEAVETLTQGNIMFLLIDTNTLITGTRTTGQTYTATFSGLNAGVYDIGIYFSGNDSYSASQVVYSSIVIKKSVVSNTNAVTSSYTATGSDYKVQLTLPITVTSSDVIVYNDLQQEPIYRENISSNTVTFSDTLLKKGTNDIYVHVSNNNTITSFPTLVVTVPKINIASISVTPSVTTTTYNSSVTFTATVASSKTGDNVNEGEIVFVLNNTSVIKYVPVSNNVATASFVLLDLGSSAVTAKFINSINYGDSTTSSCNVTINTAPITLTLTKNNVTQVSKQAIVSATLSTASDQTNDDLLQTGTVTFTTVDAQNNSSILFSDVPVRNSVASVEFVISPNISVYNISATFSGNARYSTATSNSIVITPTLGTIVSDYSSVTYTVDYSLPSTGRGFMTVTATVTPVQDNYFYKNNGVVVFSMNGVFMNIPISNGTAVAKFVQTTSSDTPTVTFQNLDYYSDMLTGSLYTEPPTLVNLYSGILSSDRYQTYTFHNTYSIPITIKAVLQYVPDPIYNTINPNGFWTFSLYSLGAAAHNFDNNIIFSTPLPYSGGFEFSKIRIIGQSGIGGSFYPPLGGQLILYNGTVTSLGNSSPVATPLALPTPYELVSKAGDQSVELLFESVGKYFNVSSSPSVSVTNPVTATSVSLTQKKITITGLTTGTSYTFTLTATNSAGTLSYTSPFTFPAAVPFVFTTSVISTLPSDTILIDSMSSISASYLNNLYFSPGTNMSNVTDGLNFTITGMNYNNGDIITYAQTFPNQASGHIKLDIPTISITSNISVVKIYSTLGSAPFLTLTLSTDGTTITVSNVPATTNGIFYFN
jgi:hypothetical protein